MNPQLSLGVLNPARSSSNNTAPPRCNTCFQQRLQQCNHIHTLDASKNMLITPETMGIPFLPLMNAIVDPNTGTVRKYRQLIADPKTSDVRLHLAANEFGRLEQGVKSQIKGTNTIKFIAHSQVPNGCIITYTCFCTSI